MLFKMSENQEYSSLREEKQVIAGRNPVYEALKAGVPVDKILVAKGGLEGSVKRILGLAKDKGIPVVEVQRQKLDRESNVKNHQGIVAYAASKEYATIDDILQYAEQKGERPFVIVADGMEDPHNLGAIIRTAEAAGAHGIIIPKRHSAGMTPATAKSAAGALFHLRVARVSNIASTIDELKEKGFWIFGADGGAERLYYEADYRNASLCIVIGSEGGGISRLVLQKCDYTVRIPMLGAVESLNASAAAAILVYEAVKQRLQQE